MIEQRTKRWGRRALLQTVLLTLALLGIPVAIWAQWTTSGNDIYNSNSGNVGIGVPAPTLWSRVEIYKAGGLNRLLLTSDASQYNTLSFQRAGVLEGEVGLDASNDDLYFWVNGAERARIDDSGNVGIGTNSPLSYAVLDINTSSNKSIHTMDSTYGGLLIGYQGSTIQAQTTAEGNSQNLILQGLAANVGIGTFSPSAKLDVNGDINVSGNINAKYQDLAEWVPARQRIAAGSVVVLDPAVDNGVIRSTAAYDTSVAGVISETPGIVLGEKGPGKVKVATTGRVRVRVDATKQPIRRGDLLVTSDKEGVAMKSEPIDLGGTKIHRPGTLIGKALEPLAEGEGEILVLLSLQ